MKSRFEQGQRMQWPDWAKGIGIFLVVVGHVWRGLDNAGLPIGKELFRVVDTAIYNFHMPLFFFVAGLFFTYQFQRTQLAPFLWSRVTALIWPLIVWTWLFFLMKGLIGQLANHPVSFSDFPIIPLPPREEFWFLWALFLVQVFCALVWRWSYRLQGQIVLLIVTIALYVYRPWVGPYGAWLAGAYFHAPFLILGSLYALSAPPPRRQSVWFWSLLFVLSELVAVGWTHAPWFVQFATSAFAVLGIIRALDCLGPHWQGRSADWIAWIGKASLTIYVGHVFFTASLRILLMKLGVGDVALHLVLGVIVGMIGPLVMVLILRRIGLARVLGLRFP